LSEALSYKSAIILNANQANNINVIFNLKLPFILREFENLKNSENIKSSIDAIINLEKELKLDLNTESRESGAKLYELQELENTVINELNEKSIYRDLIIDRFQTDPKLFEFYLSDLVKIKYDTLVSNMQSLELFIVKLVDMFLKYTKRKKEMGSIYFILVKMENFIERIASLLKHEDIENGALLNFLDKQDFFDNQQDLLFFDDKIFKCIVDYCSGDLIKKCSTINFLQAFKDLSDLLALFSDCFVEIFSIKVKLNLIANTYSAILFMYELVKTLVKSNHRDREKANVIISSVSLLISSKLKDNEFLTDLETVENIIKSIEIDDECISRLKIHFYSLCIEAADQKEIISLFFEQISKSTTLLKSSSSLLQKLFNNIDVDIELNFVSSEKESPFLETLDTFLAKIGLDSNFAMILIEILLNCLTDVDDTIQILRKTSEEIQQENLQETVDQTNMSILNLNNLLKNQENGFESEFTKSIEYKNVGYLTAIAYFRKIIESYCIDLIENRDKLINNELGLLLNEIFSKNESNFKNSFQILALKLCNAHWGSIYKLKDFILSNQNIDWNNELNFGEPKTLLDINLKSEGLNDQIQNISKTLLDCFNARSKDEENTDHLKNLFLRERPSLSLMIALFNSIYLPNSNEVIFEKENSTAFTEFFVNKIEFDLFQKNERRKFSQFLHSLVKNFPNHKDLHLNPHTEIDKLKVNSIIFHCFSIILTQNESDPMSSLFFKKNDHVLYWPCAEDDEEFTNLYTLKDQKFVSYTDLEISQNKYNASLGFALFKCSNQCKFYYTVGGCTRPTQNVDLKCPNGHLLMGPAYNQLHVRDGHMKIRDASNFIKTRLNELLCKAPKGYKPHDPKVQTINYTVRSIKSVSYRIMHLIVHSVIYMMKALEIKTENELLLLLNNQESNFKIENIEQYTMDHIVKDIEIISEILQTNETYIFIHAILYGLPAFLEHFSEEIPLSFEIRNKFEQAFQENLIDPLMNAANYSLNEYKRIFSTNSNEQNEIKLLLDESTDLNFLNSIKKKYPLIKTFRINQTVNLECFENNFLKKALSSEFPFIDLYLKKKETLAKLKILPELVDITNRLMDKYDHNLMRKEAREKKVCDELSKEEFESLKEYWNKNLNISLFNACKEYKGVSINKDTPLSLLLLDNRSEPGSGIQTRLILQDLAGIQNDFLDNVLANNLEVSFLKNFNTEKLPLNLVNSNGTILLKEFNDEFHVHNNAFVDPEYSRGMQVDFDYERFQFVMMNKLIAGKRLIQTEEDKIRRIQYTGELLHENVCLIGNIRNQIPQTPIDSVGLEEVKQFLKQKIESKQIEEMNKLFASLNTLICFVNSTFINKSAMSIKEYADKLKLRNIASEIKCEPLSNLTLGNIVELYEMFEHEVFFLSQNTFEDKYKHNLDANETKSFETFWNGLDKESKEKFFKAFVKFAMRCLLADLDENEKLTTYLVDRVDLWPQEDVDELLDRINEKFPSEILVKHSLGNFFELIKTDCKPEEIKKIEKATSTLIKPSIIGRASNQTSKQKHDFKKLSKIDTV
jgi:hypothetical protein